MGKNYSHDWGNDPIKTVIWIVIVCAFLLLAQVAMQQAAAAVRVCGDRAKMVKMLKDKYLEQPFAIGVSSTGKTVLEIYTGSDGSWTALITASRGTACIAGAGNSWQTMKQDFDKKT